eukprot:COSAG05_NODE_6776_length_905_cov_1.047146_2_plen_86_part_00
MHNARFCVCAENAIYIYMYTYGTGSDPAAFLETYVAVLEAAGRGLSSGAAVVKMAACRAVNRLVPRLKILGTFEPIQIPGNDGVL